MFLAGFGGIWLLFIVGTARVVEKLQDYHQFGV